MHGIAKIPFNILQFIHFNLLHFIPLQGIYSSSWQQSPVQAAVKEQRQSYAQISSATLLCTSLTTLLRNYGDF